MSDTLSLPSTNSLHISPPIKAKAPFQDPDLPDPIQAIVERRVLPVVQPIMTSSEDKLTGRSLPPEVIIQIVQHLDIPTKELRDLSLTSSTFRTACQSKLFRCIVTRPSCEKFAEQTRAVSAPHIACHIRRLRVNATSTLPNCKVEHGQEDSEVTDLQLQRSWENKFVVTLTNLLKNNAHMVEEISLHSDLWKTNKNAKPDDRGHRWGYNWYHDDLPYMLGRGVARVLGRLQFPRLRSLEFEQTKESNFSSVKDLQVFWDHAMNLEEHAAAAGAEFAYDVLAPYRKRPYFDQKEDKESLLAKTSLVETLPAFSHDRLTKNIARVVDFHADLRSDDSAKIIKLFSDLTPAPETSSSSIGLPWWMTPKKTEEKKQYPHTNTIRNMRLHLTFDWNWEIRYISLYRMGQLSNLQVLDLWNFSIGDTSLTAALRTCTQLVDVSFFAVRIRSGLEPETSMPDTWGNVFAAMRGIKTLLKVRLNRLRYLRDDNHQYCNRFRTLCPMYQRDVDEMGNMVAQVDKQRVAAGEVGTLEEWRVDKGYGKDWGNLLISEKGTCYCDDHLFAATSS